MYEFKRLYRSQLSSEMLNNYPSLIEDTTTPSLCELINDKESHYFLISLGAYYFEQFVGLAILINVPSQNRAELKNFYIDEIHKDNLSGLLLQKLEEEVIKDSSIYFKQNEMNGYQLEAPFYTDLPAAPFLEKLLYQAGWKTQDWSLDIHIHNQFNAPWLDKPRKIFKGFEIFFWKNLSQEERLKIYENYQDNPLFFMVNPFTVGTSIEFFNRLGMRYQGQVIGWIITARLSVDTLYYSSLFIDPKWQSSGILMEALIQSINLHRSQFQQIPKALFKIHTHFSQTKKTWGVEMIKKKFIPYATQQRTKRAGIKSYEQMIEDQVTREKEKLMVTY